MTLQFARFIPWLPIVAAIFCALCCTKKSWRHYASWICLASVVGSFILSLMAGSIITPGKEAQTVTFFEWIHAGRFQANFHYYFDTLTIVMLYVITGIGSLVIWYAGGYMKGDRGYARFFMAVSLFIFSMTTLVMADNLLLLFLGWEGVGLCSYLLIGYYYDKPSAVAAGKKAFIVNRIGDLCFILGIFLTYREFGTIAYEPLFEALADMEHATGSVAAIPFLFMLGAFGKSAQLPLYVWLPDAMEGPTPVSALIHAATMVTAGVYLIARMMPMFVLSPYALPVVATVGGLTALFAATIALCQYDIKRIFAYSTVSQLGYMFLGLGAASSVGAVFHLFTHAFFKALLFLTAGSVMHAMAGQLDLRKMGGLRHKMPVTCWLMFAGCLALAGVPLFSGFYSKDLILGDAMAAGLNGHNPWMTVLAWMGLFTAFLTAFYTFRLWFRVFWGPDQCVMGDDHHDDGGGHHPHEPHEMPWSMNLPLVFLAVGAVIGGMVCHEWMTTMVLSSSAGEALSHGGTAHHASLFGMDVHSAVMVLSIAAALLGIALAAWFHLIRPSAADRVKQSYAGLCDLLENKYFVDELYDAVVVRPLKLIGSVCFVIDRLVIDGMVSLVGFAPRLLGLTVRPTQSGSLQGYGLSMVVGLAIMLLLVTLMWGY